MHRMLGWVMVLTDLLTYIDLCQRPDWDVPDCVLALGMVLWFL